MLILHFREPFPGPTTNPVCEATKRKQPRENQWKPVFARLFVRLEPAVKSYANAITLYDAKIAWF